MPEEGLQAPQLSVVEGGRQKVEEIVAGGEPDGEAEDFGRVSTERLLMTAKARREWERTFATEFNAKYCVPPDEEK